MNEIHKILSQNERIIWEGRPQFWPYLSGVIPAVIFGAIWSAFLIPFFVGFINGSAPWYIYLFFTPFVLIGLYLLIGSWIYQVLSYKYIWYVMTDKRIILQGGIIGRDFKYIDYDKVTSSLVEVGVFDKLFGQSSGSIYVITGIGIGSQNRTVTTGSSLLHVTEPYKVFELFKKVSHDIKTDIHYPNAMRPQQNSGYQTEYKPEDTQTTQP